MLAQTISITTIFFQIIFTIEEAKSNNRISSVPVQTTSVFHLFFCQVSYFRPITDFPLYYAAFLRHCQYVLIKSLEFECFNGRSMVFQSDDFL